MHYEMCNPISLMSNHRILFDKLVIGKVCACSVPKDLTDDHKKNCMGATLDLLARYSQEDEAFLDCIVTGAETWVHCYILPTKKQSMVRKSADEPAPQKFKQVRRRDRSWCQCSGT